MKAGKCSFRLLRRKEGLLSEPRLRIAELTCCNRELSRLVRLNLGQVEPVALKIIALIVTIHILEGQQRSIPDVSVVNPKCGSGLVSTLPGTRPLCWLTAWVSRRPWVTRLCPSASSGRRGSAPAEFNRRMRIPSLCPLLSEMLTLLMRSCPDSALSAVCNCGTC